jgi:hypothetical protein
MPRSGYDPTSQWTNSTSEAKNVDGNPKFTGFSGFDAARLGRVGDGLTRDRLRKKFDAARRRAEEAEKAGRKAGWNPHPKWLAAEAAARKAAEDTARDLAGEFEAAEALPFIGEAARRQAEQDAEARLRAEEWEELDAEHLEPSRLAEHLPADLAKALRKLPAGKRRKREEAILKKVGWKGVGLIGLDPAALAAMAEAEAAKYREKFPAFDADRNAINMEPEHRKRRTDSWWRKRLRRDQGHALIYVEAATQAFGGPNSPDRQNYVTDYLLDLHRKHEKRTREIMADQRLVREDDPRIQLSMLLVDEKSRERKAAERRMLIDVMLHRWKVLGWSVCWITVTLPGEYVPHSTNEGRRATEWNPDLGPLEAMAAIQDDFHRVMCLLRERGIRPQGWWNAQPQQSGTPHRHILLALPTVEQAREVCDAFRREFSTRKEGEDGPDRGCTASVIGDDHPDYRTRDGKNGSPETAASVARYSARYSTRYTKRREKAEGGGEEVGGDDKATAAGRDEHERAEAWMRSRRVRGHTWLGLDAKRSPVEIWRTLWVNALRSDYQPDDARMALAMRHMRSAKAFIEIAVSSRAGKDAQTMQRAQEDAAREAWHAAIAAGLWPDADLDPVELEWLHGETARQFEFMDIADPLPPVPLREQRESAFGETRSVIVGAVGTVERFRLSGKPTRAELFEAAEFVGVEVDRPRAKLRRQHVLDSIEAAGHPVTWRERKLTLAALLDLAEGLGVTVVVPEVAPTMGAAMRALKEAGFGLSRRPGGSLAVFDTSGEILLRCQHRWKILSTEDAEKLVKEAETPEWRTKRFQEEESRCSPSAKTDSEGKKEGRGWAYLSDSPNDPSLRAVPATRVDDGPPG